MQALIQDRKFSLSDNARTREVALHRRCVGRTLRSHVIIPPQGAEALDLVATDPGFVSRLLENVRNCVTIQEAGVRLEFRPTTELASNPVPPLEHIRLVETEQSNSTVLIDSDYVVKMYRKLQAGVNPEIEVGLFFTDVAGYANTLALLGSVERVEGERTSAIAVVHAFVHNQRDAWTMTAPYLDRFVEDQLLFGESGVQVFYRRYMSQTGRRAVEMHIALASRDDAADFKPEPWESEKALYEIKYELAHRPE